MFFFRDVSWHSYLKFRIRRINAAYNFPSYGKWLCKQRGLESRLRQTVNEKFKSTISYGPVYMEKTWWQGHPPTRATLGESFHTFPYKTWRTVYMKRRKVGSARRVTRLAGSPFVDGLVTLLIPCKQRFLSCMSFSVYEVVRVTYQSRSKPLLAGYPPQ